MSAAAAFVAPLMAFGYYASHPEHLGITVTATLSGVGSVHGRHLPESARRGQRVGIAREAEHLFKGPTRGPRADRYLMLTRSERGLQPVKAQATTVAKAPVQADMTATASIPAPSMSQQAGLALPRKTARADVLPAELQTETFGLLPRIPVAERTGASLFLSMLSRTVPAGLSEDGSKLGEGSTELPTLKNGKRRLAFKGETETEYQARQRRCLATAIYFEARGEPVQGQLAVAQVVMNRVRSSLYPDTICGVVYQGQHRRTGCQFSFTCDGRADVPKDKERWRLANELAFEFTKGDTFLGDIGHATHYHANYVSPRWRRELNKIKKVGRHIFYRVRGEQIEDVLKEESPARGLAFSKSG